MNAGDILKHGQQTVLPFSFHCFPKAGSCSHVWLVCCALAAAVLWIPGLAPGLILPANGMLPSP
jgi:hypothetical protein